VGFPLEFAGQKICHGDMIIADADGVVMVPFEEIDKVIKALERVRSLEKALDARVADGLVTHDKIAAMIENGTLLVTND
jgi:4-hydroxy-4-methyl-2-oxoglutarate aldolase